jgi:hypothetical protein
MEDIHSDGQEIDIHTEMDFAASTLLFHVSRLLRTLTATLGSPFCSAFRFLLSPAGEAAHETHKDTDNFLSR